MKKLSTKTALGLGIIALLAYYKIAVAHGGEDHSEEKKLAGTGQTDLVEIEKESQFLLDIRTAIAKDTPFSNVLRFLGTIIPSTEGSTGVVIPQSARIISINVKPGQKVVKGQLVAMAEQNLSATDQLQYASERAKLEVEIETAKADYERLKSIQDIVAKKEIKEAEIRYRAALKAKQVYDQNARVIPLRAPISGTVDNFILTTGSQVEAGTQLFQIINLAKVWVQAQARPEDIERITEKTKFRIQSKEGDMTNELVRFVSISKSVDPTNQSVELILELDNPGEQFKVGQFVTAFGSTEQLRNSIVVPSGSVSDLAGKPVIFTHEEPETFGVFEVRVGQSDGVWIEIIQGIPAGKRVVVSGAYQVKSIFLTQ